MAEGETAKRGLKFNRKIPSGIKRAVPGAKASGSAGKTAPVRRLSPATNARARKVKEKVDALRGGVSSEDARAAGKYARSKTGPELLIAFGIIAVLAIAAIAVGVSKNKEQREHEAQLAQRNRILEANMTLASEAFKKAEIAGKAFVLGKDDTASDEKLFGPLKSDAKVYNVVYDRNTKTKKGKEKTIQKTLYADKLRIETTNFGREEGGVRLSYGFAESKTIPIVLATKAFAPDKEDGVNLGGAITVIVLAESDAIFDKAREVKPAAPAANP